MRTNIPRGARKKHGGVPAQSHENKTPTAPAARQASRRGRAVRSRPRPSPWLALVGAILILIVGFLIYRSVSRGSSGETVALLPATHVSADTPASYNSNPPTSGSHTAEPAPWGVSTSALPDISLVHNLEHGGIVLHYRPDLDAAQLQQLTDLAGELQRRDRKVVLAPRVENDTPITATAWGKILKQQNFDGDEIRAFFNAHINRGPERVP